MTIAKWLADEIENITFDSTPHQLKPTRSYDDPPPSMPMAPPPMQPAQRRTVNGKTKREHIVDILRHYGEMAQHDIYRMLAEILIPVNYRSMRSSAYNELLVLEEHRLAKRRVVAKGNQILVLWTLTKKAM